MEDSILDKHHTCKSLRAVHRKMKLGEPFKPWVRAYIRTHQLSDLSPKLQAIVNSRPQEER